MNRPGRRLNVMLLNYEFPPMGGGAGHASYELAKRLVRDGCRVDVVTSGLEGASTGEQIDGINVVRVRSARRGIHDSGMAGALSYVWAAIPRCRDLLRSRRYDVVHYYFGVPTGLLMLLLPGLRHIPSIVSLRGSDVPGYDQQNTLLGAMHFALLPATRWIWRSAHKLVANSAGLRELAERVCSDRSIKVIPNGIDLELFTPRRSDPHAEDRTPGPVRIISVARLVPRKGLEHLIRAARSLGGLDFHLSIYGTGSDARNLQEMVSTMGMGDRVTLAGYTDRTELPDVYRDGDIFVLPSVSESCSMALLEAMASGLPVVVTRVGGNSEIVDDGSNGILVPPEDPDAIAAAIRRLVSDPSTMRVMGLKSREIATRRYSADLVAARYLETYQDLAREALTEGEWSENER